MTSEIKVNLTKEAYMSLTNGRRWFDDDTSEPYDSIEEMDQAYEKNKHLIALAERNYNHFSFLENRDCMAHFDRRLAHVTDQRERDILLL